MTTLYCAICGERFEPDDDHVRVEAEYRRINDKNEFGDYTFHPGCWNRVSGGWMEQA